MKQFTDSMINRVIWAIIGIILLIWVFQGGPFIMEADPNIEESEHFVKEYLHFLILTYVFVSIQVAGFIEMKRGQHYLPAFILSIFTTPIGALIYYFIKKVRSRHEN